MSGGGGGAGGGGGKDRKSRTSKTTQGWEEAGAEFYQESFPTDLESAVQRDPAAIATLLPSKQNRAATTRRARSGHNNDNTKRRQSTATTKRRNSTSRRGSHYHEVQVAMLPDLSENLTDEEHIWEKILEIKSMPISMSQKKEMKADLQNATKLRLQGFDQIKWQRRKVWQQFQLKTSEFMTKMELWRNSLKTIEGHFGTGVVAYFLFLRWLMFLNLVIFLLIFLFIVIPQIWYAESGMANRQEQQCILINNNNNNNDLDDGNEQIMLPVKNTTECCTELYLNSTKDNSFFILDIIQGTGFMEKTLMFYGMYTNQILNADGNGNSNNNNGTSSLFYDLPLAYVCVSAAYLLLSLIAIVKAASREFKDRLIEGEGQFYQYCNLVFGGWDFCIHNEKSATIKHKALYNEIKGLLLAKRMEYERTNRSKETMFKLIGIRFLINIVVIGILISAAIVIYLLFNITLDHLYPNFSIQESLTFSLSSIVKAAGDMANDATVDGGGGGDVVFDGNDTILSTILTTTPTTTTTSTTTTPAPSDLFKLSMRAYEPGSLEERLLNFFYEFLPYIAIVGMNLLVPLIFNYLVQFEQYSPMFVIKITLLRTIFLRLASLVVLLSRFYFLVNPKTPLNGDCFNYNWGTPQCWETFVGQQFYKLFITDFATHIFVTFFINFPRSLLARYWQTKFIKLISEQEFELSKHVLDIVYSQTLCWIGSFYAPFLPAIAVLLHFFMFYIKKFACLINSKPSAILYRASRSNSLFMFILLLSFVIAVIPVVYAVAEILPSRSCGPFRGLTSVWEAAIFAFMKLPNMFQHLIFFFGTAGFGIPAFVVLTLCLYYYYAVSAANKHMVEVLKNQLVLEGHDKQFLLNRLSSFLKQQQDYQKKMRQAEHRREAAAVALQQQQQQQHHHHHHHRNDRNSSSGGGGGGGGNSNGDNI